MEKTLSFLPYSRQCIEEDDIAAVVNVLRSDFLTTGPTVFSFEKQLAKFVDSSYALVVNSGTSALHLAILSLDIGPGDWVIVPSITFLATANAVRLCGADVIFADVDPDNGLMTAEHLQAAIAANLDKKIKAVIPVHMAGQTEDLQEIRKTAKKYQLYVIEDACHALGTAYNKEPIGNCRYSDLTAFSFHPVKNIAMGEGGALTTQNADLYQRLLQLRNHGMVREPENFLQKDQALDRHGNVNPWYYEMSMVGLNYRASDIHCALGLSQLDKLSRLNQQRVALVAHYDAALSSLYPQIKTLKKNSFCHTAWHLYPVLIDFEQLQIERSVLMMELKKVGIGTQVHYIPVHRQPYYLQRYGEKTLVGADAYYQCTLSLPMFPSMTVGDVDFVVSELTKKIIK